MTTSLPAVLAAARRLRAAIERIPISLASFERFPLGACGDASELLGEYLSDCGLGPWIYVMAFTSGPELRSHGWVEQDGVIADITADQFAAVHGFDTPLPVIVTRDRRWHDLHFPSQTRSRRAGLDWWSGPTHEEVASVYRQLREAAEVA